jgi:hypothetical protein
MIAEIQFFIVRVPMYDNVFGIGILNQIIHINKMVIKCLPADAGMSLYIGNCYFFSVFWFG